MAARWSSQRENAGVGDFFGTDLASGSGADELRTAMDDCGVDVGVLSCGLNPRSGGADDMLALADAHPGRFLVAPSVDQVEKPTKECRRIRELAPHPAVRMVRVSPLVEQYPLNHRLYYPVYATCAELGLPVSINVGVPGPKMRSGCQHPELLEDVLIDFPQLVVVGAHMGHPYEALLIQYMLKWENLHLSSSAYLATYMDPALVRFMDSSRGRGRVLFASDHPVLPMKRAIDAARALPLSDEAMGLYLGGTAARVLGLEAEEAA
jgi:predicted TIM-barrel fold metal-dependent hydrolase